MLQTVPWWQALALDSLIWALWSVLVGWWAARLPPSALAADGWLTRLRPFEHQGRLYGRLGIRRWKSKIPDAGRFAGGRPKELAAPLSLAAWLDLAAETGRAERAHWLIPLAFPVEALLHGGVVLAPMAAYALVANAPCIATQRYNRGRLLALVQRRARRERQAAGPADPGAGGGGH